MEHYSHLRFLPIFVHAPQETYMGVHAIRKIIDNKPLSTIEFVQEADKTKKWEDFLKSNKVINAIQQMKHENEYVSLVVFSFKEKWRFESAYYHPAILIVA
jgi:hypothetical protein